MDRTTKKHFIFSMILYSISIVLVSMHIDWFKQNFSFGQYIAVALTILPILYMAITLIIGFSKEDEMMSQISLKGLAIGFLVGSLFSVSYGLLEIFVGLPSLNGFVYWTVLGGSWGLAGGILRMRMS